VRTFADLGVPSDLVDALAGQGIDAPFAIQTETIPPALAGRDVSGRAPTGSGKTIAFGVPLVANVQRARPKRPRALVLVPTRELAAQVSRDLARLGAGRDVRVHAFYGGTKFEPQVTALRRGVDIAVACPGRLADLVNQGIARLDGVDLVVIDEADRMADMGFLPEVRRLVDQTDAQRQTLLFSATLDGDVDALVRRYQHEPVTVDVTPEISGSRLEHHFWSVPHAKKIEVTARIVDRVGPSIVFTRTRHGADRVARQLERAGVEAVAIHGNRTQAQRDRALRAFRRGEARALVATDVAARGIHVDDVTCVVHFDLPSDPKDFLHRSGRTGRAGAAGVVVALAMPDRRRENTKLFGALEVDVTLRDPDFDRLPAAPAHRKRPRRPDRSGGDGRARTGSPTGRKTQHKPSGARRKSPADAPADTGPGRTKGAPARARPDPRRGRDRARDGGPVAGRSGGGARPRSAHDDPQADGGSPGGARARSRAPRDRPDQPRRGGPGPRRARSVDDDPPQPGRSRDDRPQPGRRGEDRPRRDRPGPGDPNTARAGTKRPKPKGSKSKDPKSKRTGPGGAPSKKATSKKPTSKKATSKKPTSKKARSTKAKAKHGTAPTPKRKPKNRARNAGGPKRHAVGGRPPGSGRPGSAR
jgi:superfamily II DNA/RNA helicase